MKKKFPVVLRQIPPLMIIRSKTMGGGKKEAGWNRDFSSQEDYPDDRTEDWMDEDNDT